MSTLIHCKYKKRGVKMENLQEKKKNAECFAKVLKEATEQEQREMKIFLAGMKVAKELSEISKVS